MRAAVIYPAMRISRADSGVDRVETAVPDLDAVYRSGDPQDDRPRERPHGQSLCRRGPSSRCIPARAASRGGVSRGMSGHPPAAPPDCARAIGSSAPQIHRAGVTQARPFLGATRQRVVGPGPGAHRIGQRCPRSTASANATCAVLFYGEDLSIADVARELGCSPRTVEHNLHSARIKLSAALGLAGDGEAAP